MYILEYIHVHCREIVTLLTKRALIGLHCCFGIQSPAKTEHIDNALATFGFGGIGFVLHVCKEIYCDIGNLLRRRSFHVVRCTRSGSAGRSFQRVVSQGMAVLRTRAVSRDAGSVS